MRSALALAALSLVIGRAGSVQPTSVLHIRVSLVDASQKPTPVPRHALLISDNPPSAAPRRVVTALDGTANVSLRPGNYTVESDEPVVLHGRAFHWTQMLDIVAGQDAVLDLTAANAEVETATGSATRNEPLEADPSAMLMQWRDTVVSIWTTTSHASGFVINTDGLVATSQRAIASATSLEVQLTPAVKVAGSVLVSDPGRDIAILRVNPAAVASMRSMSFGCALPSTPLAAGQKIFAIEVPLREERSITSGVVTRVEPHAVESDLILGDGSAGGPVFSSDGTVIGITSIGGDRTERRRGNGRVVRADDACDLVASAEKKMKGAAPPSGAHLPVEPEQPLSVAELEQEVKRRTGSLSPYQMSSLDFDIAFITPVIVFGAQRQAEQSNGRERDLHAQATVLGPPAVRPLEDFSNWSEYVEGLPRVLLVRVTPKQVESFWTTVARGAAVTQGIALPPIRHFKSGFSRMRALCGDAEVTPIHPFRLEQRVSESEAIYEGLYVFDPRALGPECRTVTLVLYSEKAATKGDARAVDAKLLQQIWRDFDTYRLEK